MLVTDGEGCVVYANDALRQTFARAGVEMPAATGAAVAALGPDVAAVLLERATEVGASVAREGLEFGVVARTPAASARSSVAAGRA